MKKVVLDFIRFSVVSKIALFRSILHNMTGNEHFPTPDVPLADAKAAVDKLDDSEQAARDGSHTAIATRNADEVTADNIFRLLAAYVDRMAAGDEVIILSSGFHMAKQPAPNNKPILQAVDGQRSGSVKLIAKAIGNAGAYIWQYAKDAIPVNESDWTTASTTTQASYEIVNLTVASKYYFRMAAVTPQGIADYTPAVMKVVG